MRNPVELRYGVAFKRRVVEEVESGPFDSLSAASVHHGIDGATTVRNWVPRMGKGHLLAKVVRVEPFASAQGEVGEADRMAAMREQLERLQRALGQTRAEKLLNAECSKLAGGQLGGEVEAFKRRAVGQPCTGRAAAVA